MKKALDFIKSNFRQIVQLVLLVLLFVIPLFIDWAEVFKDYISKEYLTPQNFIWRFFILGGSVVFSLGSSPHFV